MPRTDAVATTSFWSKVGMAGLAALSVGCHAAPFPTVIVYETSEAYVRLEANHLLTHHAGYSHPVSIAPDLMAAVLEGIQVEEPYTRLPVYDDLSIPRRHPAFTESDIDRFAPLLSLALRQATPEEVVTFYQSTHLSGSSREVTSGGLFVEGDELHLLLSNLRSGTHPVADIGVAPSEDDRLRPLESLAPQRGALVFLPASAARNPAPSGLKRITHWDRREVIVRFHALTPRSQANTPADMSGPGRPPR